MYVDAVMKYVLVTGTPRLKPLVIGALLRGAKAPHYPSKPQKQKSPSASADANGSISFCAGRHYAYTHSSAPFFHIQMYPTIRMPRKISISSRPNRPSSLNCTAQGNRKMVSTSKTTNKMATI